MVFDEKKFTNTQFQSRQDTITLPALASFFTEGEPEWTVRGLTGPELGNCMEAVAKRQNRAALIDALAGAGKEKADMVKELFGLASDTPDDVIKRLELLVHGSVDPKVDLNLSLKLCTNFPIEFYELTNKVTQLTGEGHEPGKRPPSGQSQRSEQP